MYRPMTRKSFLTNGGKAVIGASLAGSLLASCGGQEGSTGELTYWSALEGAGPRQYAVVDTATGTLDWDAFTIDPPWLCFEAYCFRD